MNQDINNIDNFEWPKASRIDMQTYPRRGLFEHFMEFEVPVVNRTLPIDLTALKSFIKENNYQFSLVIGFILTRAVNHVPELRHRILDGELVDYDKIVPAFTVLSKDKRLFFSKGVFSDVFLEDYRQNSAINERAGQGLEKHMGADNLGHIYITINPWNAYTALTFPYTKKFGSVPTFGIGKMYEEGGKIMAPLAIQNHHALTDGYHIGHFIDIVQCHLDDPKLIEKPFTSVF